MTSSFPTPYVGRTELAWMRPLSIWLRWGALGIAVALMAAGLRPVTALWLVVGGVILTAFAVFRSIPALGARVDLRAVLTLEPLLGMAAVLVTGGFASPYIISLCVPTLFMAMAVGWRIGWVLVGVIALLGLHELLDGNIMIGAEIGQSVVPLVVAGAVGALSRRVLVAAEDTQDLTLGRQQEPSRMDALPSTLHDLVRTGSAPLTVESVMSSVTPELDELFDPDSIQLIIADRGGRSWRTGFTRGVAARNELADDALPAALIAQQRGGTAIVVGDLGPDGGLDPDAVSGVYVWLWSQGRPTGLLAVEAHQRVDVSADRVAVLNRLAPRLGLAIDNAIWSGRLQTLGADRERQRLGAELHDQFASSLVDIAKELDRTAERHPEDEALGTLRTEVGRTVADLRETLHELRLRVTEEVDLGATLRTHLGRFSDRYDVATRIDVMEGLPRAPLPIENQLLRITQDLLLLARRESGATAVSVTLGGEVGRLRLVVGDNGHGRHEGDLEDRARRVLSFVRERADAIGGIVDVMARPGVGTEVAVTVSGIADGRLSRPPGTLDDLPPPLPPVSPGEKTASERLQELRDAERY